MSPLTQFDPRKIASDGTDMFKGEIVEVKVIDPARPGHTGNLVVDPTNPFTIEVEWVLTGPDVPVQLGHSSMSSTWDVRAYAESMGPGPDVLLGTRPEPVGAPSDPYRKRAPITVPAGTLPEHSGGLSGVYKLVTAVFLNSNDPTLGLDICGFAEGPMIMVESPI